MARRHPPCDVPGCDKPGWEYTITFNEGVVLVNLCDNDASPMQAVMRHGRFTRRKGKKRRRDVDTYLY